MGTNITHQLLLLNTIKIVSEGISQAHTGGYLRLTFLLNIEITHFLMIERD